MSARVRKATRYPAVVACVVLGVTVFMMAGVVPQVVDFLAANNQELPIWTVALIATSALVQDYWPLLLGLPRGGFLPDQAPGAALGPVRLWLGRLPARPAGGSARCCRRSRWRASRRCSR